jgi:ABC-type Mn2+/Zn2+ transport system ATPase subunit
MAGRGPASAVSISDVVVAYRDNVALRGVSLEVREGEFVGIIGPNGAGKTTLLTVVNGLRRPRSGRVSVLGRSPLNGDRHSLRSEIGYLAQLENVDVRMPMTVRDVVMIGRYGVLGLFRGPGKRDHAVVDEALELVGMSRLAGRPIGHLSGGERQRAAIARCLAQEPRLLLLDEPTASLDWKAQASLLDLVRDIHRSRGLTMLFVTHDLSALPVESDRIVLMKDGAVCGDGPPAGLLTDDALSELYDMPAAAVQTRRAAATI